MSGKTVLHVAPRQETSDLTCSGDLNRLIMLILLLTVVVSLL